MIGISATSKTTENILRSKECVLNMPSVLQVSAVDKLALTTGSNPVPAGKLAKGYRYEADKFGTAGLTAVSSDKVQAPRVKECPVNLEASLSGVHPLGIDTGIDNVRCLALELTILQVHAHLSIMSEGKPDHIDPDKWRPLMMSFQKFYGLGEQVAESRLAGIPEEKYRPAEADIEH